MSSPAYTHSLTVSFDEADPAGIAFFSRAYVYAHRAYEAFFRAKGLGDLFSKFDLIIPFVHSECEHLAPMVPGDSLEIDVFVESLGNSSMVLNYEIRRGSTVCARVKLVSVFVDPKTFEKCPIPEDIRKILST